VGGARHVFVACTHEMSVWHVLKVYVLYICVHKFIYKYKDVCILCVCVYNKDICI